MHFEFLTYLSPASRKERRRKITEELDKLPTDLQDLLANLYGKGLSEMESILWDIDREIGRKQWDRWMNALRKTGGFTKEPDGLIKADPRLLHLAAICKYPPQ